MTCVREEKDINAALLQKDLRHQRKNGCCPPPHQRPYKVVVRVWGVMGTSKGWAW